MKPTMRTRVLTLLAAPLAICTEEPFQAALLIVLGIMLVVAVIAAQAFGMAAPV
jgi:hypothetical protein